MRKILLSYEEPWYIATDTVTNVTSQGKTILEAQTNLKEALELYFEDTSLSNQI
ncbi:MAG: type II toxin-antitoxin system HicB family antitoxin [Lachnospiraceae bacterium]|nr:type II toxin-antitoxin system HicB family antitoxin [Lachnospiraceae bacterium]MBQ9234825.1 type II toxin-antitoxin system HicB family antitoxin [Lachnospiraceae bacterium]MBQ9608421.1 type II toxin-antitoxin system HicB family antitoxin [Lachnospiraceae bacterium]